MRIKVIYNYVSTLYSRNEIEKNIKDLLKSYLNSISHLENCRKYDQENIYMKVKLKENGVEYTRSLR